LLLFCEYSIRTGQNATVFMLAGCCHRMSRLLHLDSEAPTDKSPLSPTMFESRRRILWSCYLLDAMVGAGVDENLAWTSSAPEIRLPCAEIEFLHQKPSTSAMLEIDSNQASTATAELCLRAHLIRVSFLRSQTLRYVSYCRTQSIR
jgi:hypothetical protein